MDCLDEIHKDLREIKQDLKRIEIDIATLKVKSGLWGAIGAAIILAPSLVIYFMSK